MFEEGQEVQQLTEPELKCKRREDNLLIEGGVNCLKDKSAKFGSVLAVLFITPLNKRMAIGPPFCGL
jgi:hypothetical protein